MSSLYNITNEFRALFNEMSEKEEWDDTDLTTISSLSDSFDEKAIAVAAYIKELEAQADAIYRAYHDMKVRQNRLELKAQNLSDYLRGSMLACDKTKISSPYFDIKRQKNPPFVDIVDENMIPKDYFKKKESYTIDRTLIKADIEKGIDVPGAVLVKDKERLVIK